MALGYKKRQLQLLRTRALLLVLLALCVLVAWSLFQRWQVEREMAARRAAVEAEYAALQERYQALEKDVSYLQDERSLEAEIRKHFDVAKEGESVVVILDEDTPPATTTRTHRATTSARWWQFWR